MTESVVMTEPVDDRGPSQAGKSGAGFRRRAAGLLLIAVGLIAVGLIAVGLMRAGLMPPDLTWVVFQIGAESGYRVEDIVIRGDQRTSRSDLEKILQVERGMPILAVDLVAVRDRLERLPWVRAARVERHLPSTLEIMVVERKPIALWQKEQLVYVIDAHGVAIAPGHLAGFEHLLLVVGVGANEAAVDLIASLAVLHGLPLTVNRAVRVSGRRWDLYFVNDIIVKLPADGGDRVILQAALARLAALHRQHQLLAREVTTVDLRQRDRLVLGLTERGRRWLSNEGAEA